MADCGSMILPADAIAEILLRLPTSSRRRFRLVCKHWRDLVDERTPERQVRSKILAFVRRVNSSIAYVFDDKDAGSRHTWKYALPGDRSFIDMIGTCNGLLCMTELYFCDGRILVVTVTNPITGEKLTLPRLPRSANSHVYYGPYIFSFGYHPRNGQHKVVHIPFQDGEDRFVLVCTVGHDQSWREVRLPTPCESHKYSRKNIIVSVDGSTYCLTKQCDRIVALNLEDDSITSFEAPPTGVGTTPVPALPDCQLTNVQARLGVVVTRHNNLSGKTVDVWVLECGEEQPRWSLNYAVFEPIINDGRTGIMAPYFTHGEYVLSKSDDHTLLYGWKVGDLENREGEKTWMLPLEGAAVITKETGRYCSQSQIDEIFAYVETLEPLPTSVGDDNHKRPMQQRVN